MAEDKVKEKKVNPVPEPIPEPVKELSYMEQKFKGMPLMEKPKSARISPPR